MIGIGISPYLNIGSVLKVNGVPSALVAITISASRIDLSWVIGSTNHDGHSIERSADGSTGWSEIATVTGASNTYSNTGLSANHYFYRVRAYKGSKYSDYTSNAKNLVPLCIYDGNTKAWYDCTDLSTITKDSNNYVSRWNDKLGGGKDLKQLIGSAQPQYSASGINFLSSRSGGMATDDFALISQPTSEYLLIKPTGWVNNKNIINSKAVNQLAQFATTPKIKYSATYSSPRIEMSLNTYHVVNIMLSTTYNQQKLYVDESVVSGDFGPNGFERFTFGDTSGLNSADFECRMRIFRSGLDNETNRLDIFAYLNAFNAFFLT